MPDTEPKFTKGPWHLTWNKYGAFELVSGFIAENKYDMVICSRSELSERKYEQGTANANLIAAAPDLYESVKELIAALVQNHGCMVDSDKAIANAEAALARARGEQV